MPTSKVQPKMYEFLPAIQKKFDGIEVDGKILKFGKKAKGFTTHDVGLANEINARYGWKNGKQGPLIMNTVDTEHKDRRVKLFRVPQMPWKEEE